MANAPRPEAPTPVDDVNGCRQSQKHIPCEHVGSAEFQTRPNCHQSVGYAHQDPGDENAPAERVVRNEEGHGIKQVGRLVQSVLGPLQIAARLQFAIGHEDAGIPEVNNSNVRIFRHPRRIM